MFNDYVNVVFKLPSEKSENFASTSNFKNKQQVVNIIELTVV